MPAAEATRVDEVRRAFPSLNDMVYLNVATHGLTPQPVLDRYLEMISLTAHYGHQRYSDQDVPQYAKARPAIARILGVPPNWVAFNRNATDGINYVFGSLTWQAGDEVIISDQEHPAVFLPQRYGERRGQFAAKIFSIDPDPAITLRNLEERITPHTRLIVCSHVSSMTGIRVPGPGICAMAKRLNDAGRDRPILTLIDGTQEAGQWLVDVPAIGCDYYVSNGHKWLGGPKGSGFLVASPAACAHLTPPYMAGGIEDHGDSIEDMINHRDAPHLFESATQNLAVVSVLADAVEWLDNLGWSWIVQREQQLAAYLRGNLREISGLTLLTPDAWELSSAITSFTIEGTDAAELQKTLWDQRIITRLVGEKNGLRIATPYFTTEDELDQLLDALSRIRV
jgi:selenocysteine lyase/cysteine desulfurase